MELENNIKFEIGRKYLDALEKGEIEQHYFSADLTKEVTERKKRLLIKNSQTGNNIIEMIIDEDNNKIEANVFDEEEYIEGYTLDIFKELLISHYNELSKNQEKNTRLFFNNKEVSIDDFLDLLCDKTWEDDEFEPLSSDADEELIELEIEYEDEDDDEEEIEDDDKYEDDSFTFESVDSIEDAIAEERSDSDIKELINNESAIHINRSRKEIYIKLPIPIKYNKVKINKLGKLVEEICNGEKYHIYAINEAGEVYKELSIEKLIGKEELTVKDEGKHVYRYNGSKTKAFIDDFNKSIKIYADDSEDEKVIHKMIEKLEREKHLYNESKFVLLRSKSYVDYDYEELGKMYYETNGSHLLSSGCEDMIDYINELYGFTDSKSKKQEKEEQTTFIDAIDPSLSNRQNAIFIEKDFRTKKVDKYIYDCKKDDIIHTATIQNDSKDQFTRGMYININEYVNNLISSLIEKYGDVTEISFLTKDNKEIEFYELLESAFKECSEAGGICVGRKYSKLIADNEFVTYKDLEELYDSSAEYYHKIPLNKGLYLRKDIIDEYFKELKLKTKVHKESNNDLEKSYSKK